MRRAHDGRIITFAEQYHLLKPGELLTGGGGPVFASAWAIARSDGFSPVEPLKIAAE